MCSDKSLGAHLERFSSTIIYTLLGWLFLFFLPLILILEFPDRQLEQMVATAYLIAGVAILWKTGFFKKPFQRLTLVDVYENGLIIQRFGKTLCWEWQDIDFFTSKAEPLYHPRFGFGRQPDGSYQLKKILFETNRQLKLYTGEKVVFRLPFVGNRERLYTAILEQVEPIFIERLLHQIEDGESVTIGDMQISRDYVHDTPTAHVKDITVNPTHVVITDRLLHTLYVK
ncbi:MAG: hypothetical protein L0154_01980 [Chloroflexi bacterium]|nr:hypothetical protein [Chloroflexota bacterium]